MLAKAAFCIVAIVTAAATGYMVELIVDAFQSGSPHGWKPGGVHGAPEPLLGAAGLPLLVAYGVCRLVNRRLKPTE